MALVKFVRRAAPTVLYAFSGILRTLRMLAHSCIAHLTPCLELLRVQARHSEVEVEEVWVLLISSSLPVTRCSSRLLHRSHRRCFSCRIILN